MNILFENVTAVLMDDDRTVLKNAYVAVDNGKIASVGTQRPEGEFSRVIGGTGKVLMPGFVNTHTHVPMVPLRGYGGGHNLQDWLNNYIFPAESKWNERAIRSSTAWGLAEMIASGVTCIADMYSYTGTVAQEVLEAGVSANLSCGGVYFGAAEGFSPEICGDCHTQRRITEEWHNADNGRIRIDASIHGEYTSCAPLWQWMASYACDHGLRMHVHVSETRSEHADSLSRHQLTPLQILDKYGVWDNGGIAAHCIYTTPEDWEIMVKKDVTAIHNPMSNLKLGSGVAPIPTMMKAGVNVALGTDGVSSNNTTDLFSDMKLAAILHNGVNCDPMAMAAYDALKMATVNGAKALGRNTGRIAPGCDADLILVDFDRPNNYPCHDVVENLVYATRGADVVMNMCRGRVIYENGEFLTIDLEKVKYEIDNVVLPLLFG